MSSNDSSYSKSILISDDDPDFLSTLVDMINVFGYDNIITAQDGEEVISSYKENKPDLVLIGIDMSHDGISAFFEIIEFDPNAKVIFFSAYDKPHRWYEAKNKGAIDFLRKPIDSKFLKKLISKII